MTKKNDAAAEAGKDAADKVVAGLDDGVTGGEQGELIERDELIELDNAAVSGAYSSESQNVRGNHIALTDDGPGYFVQGEETGSRYEPTHAEKTASLIARIDAHEAEGAAIEAVMTELGHDAKSIRTIKRARAKAEAAKRTYDALFGAGIVSPGQV